MHSTSLDADAFFFINILEHRTWLMKPLGIRRLGCSPARRASGPRANLAGEFIAPLEFDMQDVRAPHLLGRMQGWFDNQLIVLYISLEIGPPNSGSPSFFHERRTLSDGSTPSLLEAVSRQWPPADSQSLSEGYQTDISSAHCLSGVREPRRVRIAEAVQYSSACTRDTSCDQKS